MILAFLAALAGLIFSILFCLANDEVEEEEEFFEDELSFEEEVYQPPVRKVEKKRLVGTKKIVFGQIPKKVVVDNEVEISGTGYFAKKKSIILQKPVIK